MQYGICPNYPYRCKNAKNKTILRLSGAGTCPSCGRALRPTRRPFLWMVAGLAVLVALGLLFFTTYPRLMQTAGKAYASVTDASGTGLATSSPAANAQPVETLLRLSGSTTIGDLGAPLLVRGWLTSLGVDTASLQSRPLIETVNGEQQPVGKIISATLNGKSVQVIIRHRGSKFGFLDLEGNQAQIAMASREINAAELATAKETGLGDMKSRFAETVIGLDGIAIIVARDNPVATKGLTLQQVHDIFTGRIRDWSEVGGSAHKIHLYIRTPGSGTYDTFRDLVLGKDTVVEPRTVIEDSQQIDARVGTDRDAIGFVSSGLVSQSTAVAVGEAGYPMLKPSIATIKAENYILRRRLYLYRRETAPRDLEASAFVAYAKSDDGQALLREAHLVDLVPLLADDTSNSVIASQAAHAGCALSEKYAKIYRRSVNSLCELHARNVKLPVTFFFNFDSQQPELENLGLDQIERVVRQVQIQSANKARSIALAGFADARGDYLYNCQLALDRAKTVGRYLTEQGIKVSKNLSFCSEAALVSSNSEEGLRQNRRVEIYIDR